MREIGLVTKYDGDKYDIICEGKTKEYPIGGLICELSRLRASELKRFFDGYENASLPATRENASAGADWVAGQIFENITLPVHQSIILGELVNTHCAFFERAEDVRGSFAEMLNNDNIVGSGKLKKHILSGTGTDAYATDTVGHYLSCLYASLTSNIVMSIGAFRKIIQSDEGAIDAFIMMITSAAHLQDIDYKIMANEGEFASIYTIKNAMSLFLFDAAHMIQHDVTPRICKNCNELFIPLGRKDARYCSYPSPQKPDRLCKEIGAQVTRAKKEKEDEVTREYRKKYLRLKMAVRRNPGSRRHEELFNGFVEDSREWKLKVEKGEATEAAFLAWIKEGNADE